MDQSITLCVGLDVHKDSIDIAVSDEPRDAQVRHVGRIGGDLAALRPPPPQGPAAAQRHLLRRPQRLDRRALASGGITGSVVFPVRQQLLTHICSAEKFARPLDTEKSCQRFGRRLSSMSTYCQNWLPNAGRR